MHIAIDCDIYTSRKKRQQTFLNLLECTETIPVEDYFKFLTT